MIPDSPQESNTNIDWWEIPAHTAHRLSSIDTGLLQAVMGDLVRDFTKDPVTHGMSVLDIFTTYGICLSDVWPVVDFLSSCGLVSVSSEESTCRCSVCLARVSWMTLTVDYSYDTRVLEAQREAENVVRTPSPEPFGHVYLLKSEGRYKIGVSRNLPQRQHQIEKQSPFPIELVHSVSGPGYREKEIDLHGKFHEARVHGEWFELTDEQVSAVIEDMNEWEAGHER